MYNHRSNGSPTFIFRALIRLVVPAYPLTVTSHPRPSLFHVVVVRLRGFTRLHRIRGRLHGHCEAWGWLESRGDGVGQGLKCFSQKVQVINETRCLIDRLIKCSRCFWENDATFWEGILFPREGVRVVSLRVIGFNECSLLDMLQGGIHSGSNFV